MDWHQLFGGAGQTFASVFVVATYSMKTMVPLRVFGIITNIVLITSSAFSGQYGTMVLHMFLLPLNSVRLYQMLQLVNGVKASVAQGLSMDWLKPFMKKRQCKKGDVLFVKDAVAEDMFYIVSGRFRLTEMGIDILPGAIIGELGMLAPDNRRTQSFECVEDGVVLTVTYQQVEQLYFQNPAFGFYFLRLATARLFENITRMEKRLTERAAQSAQS